MTSPNEVAEKIAAKAAEVCAPLAAEMVLRKWPADFRVIMWDAVSRHAAVLAAEAEHNNGKSR